MADEKKPVEKLYRVTAATDTQTASFVLMAESDDAAKEKAAPMLASIGLEGVEFKIAEA